MSSSCLTKNTLEELPDELLILICRYLSSTDVLFSFHGLNNRLSQMISGYFRHVVIAQIPYKQFKCICTSILPRIGSHITSLVVSNQWKGILSKLFINYLGESMSLIFPHLRQLTLISFSDIALKSFLDSLQNLPELKEIVICHIYQIIKSPIESKTLLHRIFTANNNQLNSILFDDESMVFFLDDNNHQILYSNVQRLSIDLKTINDLHHLLTLLPQLISISVAINKDFVKCEKLNETIPVVTLKQFQLQSFGPSWNLDNLASILKRIPNVEELSIAIEAYNDTRLMDGENFFSLFSSLTLKKFNYFLRFYDSSVSIDHTKIVSTWEQFEQEFVCIKSDDKSALVLYTLPFVFSFLILPLSIAKNEVFTESYASQVKILTLCDIPSNIIDIFSIIKKCSSIQNLNLRINADTITKLSKDISLCKLSYLTKLTALRESIIDPHCFQKLLEASPNLYHLEVNYEFLPTLFDNESVSFLLKHRISHMYILITVLTDLATATSSISRLRSIFPSLKHFYFCLEKISQSSELLILSVLKHLSEWNSLVSFGVVNAALSKEIFSGNLQQWTRKNSTLHEQHSFVADYTDDIFRLWL